MRFLHKNPRQLAPKWAVFAHFVCIMLRKFLEIINSVFTFGSKSIMIKGSESWRHDRKCRDWECGDVEMDAGK